MQQVLNKDILTCPTQPLLTESPLVVCADNAAWDAEVDDDESSNAGPSDGQPLLPYAMATLVQVSSNSGFSKLRMELFLRIDFHMKLLLGGAETFHGGNILVVLGSTISIFAVCTYAYVYV